ncbi:MAG: aminopeptidase [Chlamydiota bacterium]
MHIEQIQATLKASTALLIEDPLNLLYLTGVKCSSGKLLISKKAVLLLLDSRYLGSKSSLTTALDSKENLLNFFEKEKISSLEFNAAHTSYERFLQLQSLFPNCVPRDFRSFRGIKTKEEIEKLKKSASLLWKGFCSIRAHLKPGITEQAVSKALQLFALKHGAEALSFEPIIAFGKNSAMPHHRAGKTKLKKNDVVLIDIGLCLKGYHSDMTRTLVPKGADPTLHKLLRITKAAHAKALSLCRPGTAIGNLDVAVRSIFKKEGVEPLFLHALGHGVGLQIHEFPRIKFDSPDKDTPLEEGMVITIEPGLYIAELGGVRYEDTIVITKAGYKNFYD